MRRCDIVKLLSGCLYCELPGSQNFLQGKGEMERDCIAFPKIFCFSDAVFDGHQVAAIFGKQGGFPDGFSNANIHGDHAPAISHQTGYGLQRAALIQRNCDEIKGGWTPPVPNIAAKFDDHSYSISKPRLFFPDLFYKTSLCTNISDDSRQGCEHENYPTAKTKRARRKSKQRPS